MIWKRVDFKSTPNGDRTSEGQPPVCACGSVADLYSSGREIGCLGCVLVEALEQMDVRTLPDMRLDANEIARAA